MLVDSHCHLDIMDKQYSPEAVAAYVEQAKVNDVAYMQCVSINMQDFPKILDIANRFNNVFASVGVHPNDKNEPEVTQEELVKCAADENVIAIGETGLDYFRSSGDLDWQRDRFRTHIAAAKEAKKPLIIHIRDAFADAIKIMEEENAGEVGGVVHCFTGNLDEAKHAIDLNFHIGISGIVTFNSAAEIKEVAANIPEHRLLVETDSPFLAPVPHRGKPNVPAYVRYVAQYIAQLRDEPLEKVAAYTTENFFKLFPAKR